jgi:hypothetical protein
MLIGSVKFREGHCVLQLVAHRKPVTAEISDGIDLLDFDQDNNFQAGLDYQCFGGFLGDGRDDGFFALQADMFIGIHRPGVYISNCTCLQTDCALVFMLCLHRVY